MEIQNINDSREYLDDMAEELNALAEMDQMEMYRMLTDLGNSISAISESDKTEENFVKGCISNVYLSHEIRDDRIYFHGSSEAMVVRGYLSILINALSGLSPGELLSSSRDVVEDFGEKTNIRATLTPSRANAFGNIYGLMRTKADQSS